MNVVITGATKGIGRAIAEKFAAEGHSIIACSRSQSDLQQMQEDFLLRFPAIAIHVFHADIGKAAEVKNFAEWIIESGLRADILINNAGYFTAGTVYSEEEEVLDKMMNINLYGAYHLCRALLPAMVQRKQGHIFNICSVASFTAFANVGSYGISKFALYGLTKILREEMKPHGIKVTAVLPGSTMTSSWAGADVDPHRLMEAKDVANMVFAASQLSPGSTVEEIIMRPQPGDL